MQIDTMGIVHGDTVRDEITGFTGKVVSVTQWYAGCARLGVQAPLGKDGNVPDLQHFDVTQVELVKAGPRHPVEAKTGGPRPAPQPR
jgi:hypothetical protein